MNGVPTNFDAEISSQSFKSQTHWLATNITKNPCPDEKVPSTKFRHLKKKEMSSPVVDAYDAQVSVYYGPKKAKKDIKFSHF